MSVFLRFHARDPLQHGSYSSHLQARPCCWKRKDGFQNSRASFDYLLFLDVQWFSGQSVQFGLMGKSRINAGAAPWWPNLILVVVVM